jgi:hypothetical protein
VNWLRQHLITDWRSRWSIWLHAVFSTVGLIYDAMPVLSPQIAAILPAAQQMKAIGFYALVGLAVRVVRQKPGA